VIAQLFPTKYHRSVPAMPVVPGMSQSHIRNEVAPEEFPIVSLSIHELIDRREWINDPAALAEIKKEADGLVNAGTWTYDHVVPRAKLEADARASGKDIAIGRLLTIVSWKNAESTTLKKLKARIYFRGDEVRDAFGQHAEFQELKVIPTTISGLNLNLAYGIKRGHSSSQSDIIKAYIQSDLKTLVETYVELPPELVPQHLKGIYRPCTRLYKSLYGHPESGGHWSNKFKSVMTELNAEESALFPSNFFIKKWNLWLTLYVDDMVLSRPTKNHSLFWNELAKHPKFEEPSPVGRVLGRTHEIAGNTIILSMTDFAEASCQLYKDVSGVKGFKAVPTPYLDETTLPIDGWDVTGQLSEVAAKVIMKGYWLARLARPDLLHALNELSRRITRWSSNDDRRSFRLFCYLDATKNYKMHCKLDPDAQWHLWFFTDADHGSKAEHGYSTSGSLLVIAGGLSSFPVVYQSKRQTACSRSTTEAETISLANALFGDGLPMQQHLEEIFGHDIPMTCHQDNTATIQVIRNGFSVKLRHLGKTHKIDVTSLYDVFKADSLDLKHCPTDMPAADVFTKNLEQSKWQHALSMIGIIEG